MLTITILPGGLLLVVYEEQTFFSSLGQKKEEKNVLKAKASNKKDRARNCLLIKAKSSAKDLSHDGFFYMF